MMTIQIPESGTLGPDALRESIQNHIKYSLVEKPEDLSARGMFQAVAMAIRDEIVDKIYETESRYEQRDAKRLNYLSMEFLMGRSLANNLLNLGIFDTCRQALQGMGVDLEEVLACEPDAGLGNGGLGRLAACFLDSLATLDMPGFGYGINYEYGLFKQEIHNGYQREKPDHWLAHKTPWQIERPDDSCMVPLYGRIEHAQDRDGNYNPMWLDWQLIIGVPCDMPIVGYGGRTINLLRLYSARSSQEFDIQIFNEGEYFKAVEQKIASETVSKILYPSDSVEVGRELRLIQEYFLVACAIRDIVRKYLKTRDTFHAFPDKVAIQLNDTHPALAVAELMRVFIDENDLPWHTAWELTQKTLSYTNHTLLPEALEKWPVALLERIIPRHLQIIREINRRFVNQAIAVFPNAPDRIARLSIVESGAQEQIRMAHLAIVGSHAVNGVSNIHTDLIKTELVPDFYRMWPDKFSNKTNGITPRRWLLNANPLLADLITNTIGDNWITDLERLRDLEPHADDPAFQHAFMQIKKANKRRLAARIKNRVQVAIDPDTLFDIQVKRIHGYKRQLLNLLHIVHDYLALVEDGCVPTVPRTHIFAGKAAPGYWEAKQIIKLIHNVRQVINSDHRTGDQIKVVFVPDYGVSLAEIIIPAADLSEQISLAGMEASGTGNMKFAINGALTIGTLDGANIEIREEVGIDNIFTFGLKADDVQAMKRQNTYHPREVCERHPEIKRAVDAFKTSRFCPGEPELFTWLHRALLEHGDEYFHLADMPSYLEAHRRADIAFQSPAVWAQKAILNVARIGKFSSDRTVLEYARDIWHIRRFPKD